MDWPCFYISLNGLRLVVFSFENDHMALTSAATDSNFNIHGCVLNSD